MTAASGGVAPTPPLIADLPAELVLPAARIRAELAGARRLVVLDDDPTGTQTIHDLPVLSDWGIDDIRWALRQETPAFFVLTNTRSLSREDAAERNQIVATACLEAAALEGVGIAFASRSDSTLRGHFPLETDVLAEVCGRHGQPIDAVLVLPAFVDAGRVTIGSVHWLRVADELTPVGLSEFAQDATFGYSSSHLAEWVEEKSAGALSTSEVERITLDDLRVGGIGPLVARLEGFSARRTVVVDALTDNDLRVLTLAAMRAEAAGSRFLYRVGPSFVRARAGQQLEEPMAAERLADLVTREPGGLIVVGSHMALTTRQLRRLTSRLAVSEVELEVARLVDPDGGALHIREVIATAIAALSAGHVVVRTTRSVVTGETGERSLEIARLVSAAVVRVVREIVAAVRPAFLVAKGGITSSDIATDGLGITRAWARGTLLPGIVSLWEPHSGTVVGMPYVVFAGNVGDDDALADVVQLLTAAQTLARA